MWHQYYDRFKLILSDPVNSKIERVPNAGLVLDNLVTMCTGLKIIKNSYYDSFSDIFLINGGVHEPSEEFIFYDIIKKLNNETPTMIELGSYWSYYSMCFLQQNPKGKCFLIEEDESCLNVGIEHFKINNYNGKFIKGKISKDEINIDIFSKNNNINKIEILLADIQGYEYEMLQGCNNLIDNKLIDYFFISTHSQEIHYNCLNYLKNKNYKIIASSDFDNETFCYDGIIVACSSDIEFTPYILYDRSKTPIISNETLNNLLQGI